MIEIDLHLTRDGSIVVAHDSDLGRLGASGSIGDFSLAEVKALDAGRGTSTRAEVPTLEQVLDLFGDRIPFNLEVKWGPSGDYSGLEARALAMLESRGLMQMTLFSSFRESILQKLRRESPDCRIALLVSAQEPPERIESMVERTRALGAEAVNPHFILVTEERVRQAHESGVKVYPYTVDSEEGMQRLVEIGVDGIFTNCPDRMRSLWPTVLA